MNELLRLLQKSLRPFGYDIRKRGTYNLLPFRALGEFPDLRRAQKDFDTNGGGERLAKGNLGSLKIIIRTCVREDRNASGKHRLTGATLEETVMRCLRSTVASVNAALRQQDAPKIAVTILDDHSDEKHLGSIRAVAEKLVCPWAVETTAMRGQGASLHEQFTRAKSDDALYYFCEDDYLHEESAIHEMWSFYRQVYVLTRRHLALHPQESGLYGSGLYPSYLILGNARRWRTVGNMTHVMFTHSFVVRDYWDCFENVKYVGNRKKRALGSESRTTNLLFEKIMGFAPLPALAGHLQFEETLPPFFDWQRLWQDYGSKT